jgi:hypothetical protein
MRTYEEETITPEIAAKYLEKDYFRRPIREDKVQRWATFMKSGGWQLNGHGIVFGVLQEDMTITGHDGTERMAKKGETVLLDGYHRLETSVRYELTFETLVARGMDPVVLNTIDENTKRTTSDDLAMTGMKDAFRSGALLRKIWFFQNFGGLTKLPKTSVGRQELARLHATGDIADQIQETLTATKRWKKSWPGNRGALDFFYWLVRFNYEGNALSTIDRYLDLIAWGAPDSQDKIIRPLIERLRGAGTEYAQERRLNGAEYQIYYMIKIWNGWVQGHTLSRLTLPAGGLKDPFPPLRRALGR